MTDYYLLWMNARAEIERLREDKKTLTKALMELGELVPDKKFWACPTCTRVNPSTRKTCYMKHGEDDE